MASQRTGLPLIDPSRQSVPGAEGSPTSPAKARHVTETRLVGHTANKHQPRDGVIPLGKVLSRPSPSAWHCSDCTLADAPKARRPVLVAGGTCTRPRRQAKPNKGDDISVSPEDGSRWASDDKSRRAFLKGAEARLFLHLSMEPRRPGVRGAGMVPLGDGARRRAEKPRLGSDEVGDEGLVTGSGSGLGARRSAMFNSPERYLPSYRCLDIDDKG